MSGRDVVRARRENGDAGQVRPGLSIDVVLGIVAMVAVVLCLILGARWLMAGPPPAAKFVVATSSAKATPLNWTAQDGQACETRARAAAGEPVPAEMSMANSTITGGGFASMATRVACYATIKAQRLCDPEQKAALVAMVNDYMTRRDLVVLGLDVQGAPMTILGGIGGGEVAMGSAIYDMTKEQTLAYMALYHGRLIAKLRALAEGGVLSAGDFGMFGMGVSPALAPVFDKIALKQSMCG